MDQNGSGNSGKAADVSLQDDSKTRYLKTDEAIKLLFSSEKNIYRKYYSSNPIIDKELKNMETTRTQFAEHLVAEGKAEGKAEVLQIIKSFIQGKTPNDISKMMDLALENVVNVLREAGLIEQTQ